MSNHASIEKRLARKAKYITEKIPLVAKKNEYKALIKPIQKRIRQLDKNIIGVDLEIKEMRLQEKVQ